ncbi:glycosyltransferase family 4 protein [Fundidesulfovibrio agrisoli]|uniref:glycosyltransferase family 4 protein n=1 Tax=Fundidesulfovibrio agrisoli TaxID=2922717 RepID=UPI001FAD1948|nr:glycosyltransferase family 1 protein [Fundidesulfovibrio agrisoli]
MRIGVSCRSLEYASGGVKEYLVSLLRALLEQDKRNTYVLFHSQPHFFGSFEGAEEYALNCSNRLLFDWVMLPSALAHHGIDVAFFPSSNMPPRVPCKAVAAMMDLGYFQPGPRMYKLADTLYMKWAMRYTACRADGFIAISEHTRRDMTHILGIPAERIAVTPLAADDIYHQPLEPEDVFRFKMRHGLERPFFLYTGNISPRKNLRALLTAFAQAKDSLDADLVVTGGLSWDDDWSSWVRSLGIEARVRRLGYVERGDMPLLYAASMAYVFPSVFEGFGLPVLEAQAMGVPVICSDATSLPEVAGQSARMVNPTDVTGLARALTEVASDPALRTRLSELGKANEARFSWKATAEKTLAVFEAVYAGNQPR